MRQRLPQGQRIRAAHIPAPTGGINAVTPYSAMPASDAVLQTNLVPGAKGLKVRTGHGRIDLTGTGIGLRSIHLFAGSTASADRFFAAGSQRIYDLTEWADDDTGSAGDVFEFAVQDANTGRGVSTTFVTSGGHFLLYCDEANGYHVYSESEANVAVQWEQVAPTGTVAWAPATAYAVGDIVTNDSGKTYICTTAGTSAGAGGPTGTTKAIVDNTVIWRYASLVTGVDPREFVHVCVWKNRVWFTRRDTSEAWYLDLASIYGPATKFDFGSRFPHGGTLVGLWSYTIDGGQGVDDHLVAVSSSGDVVVYAGTNPDDASAFYQVGSWFLGGVPSGRNIAAAYGGDLLILSALGMVPLSRLLSGGDIADPNIYATAKIRPQFVEILEARKALTGWHITVLPQDNVILVVLPDSGGDVSEQFAFSLTQKSWAKYEGLPILSSAVWRGSLWFISVDGDLCRAAGHKDGALLWAGTGGSDITWSVLTSFQNLGTPQWKRVQTIRPRVLGTAQVNVSARYDYDDSEPSGTVSTPGIVGATGIGSALAIALNGSSSAECTLVGFDVSWDEGGIA